MTSHSAENIKNAVSISQWFIQQGLDSPQNTTEGNTKLQKLLFFSWLIHFQKFSKSLFEDEFFAFTNGPVVETVRKNYYTMPAAEIPQYSSEELETLRLTKEIFGNADVEELVQLSHNSPAWQKYYKKSIQCNTDGSEFKNKTVIPKEEFEEELLMIQTVLYVHENMLADPESA
jgi:uncharacterized phage-associated protein